MTTSQLGLALSRMGNIQLAAIPGQEFDVAGADTMDFSDSQSVLLSPTRTLLDTLLILDQVQVSSTDVVAPPVDLMSVIDALEHAKVQGRSITDSGSLTDTAFIDLHTFKIASSSAGLRVTLPEGVRVDGTPDVQHYAITPLSGKAVPVSITSVQGLARSITQGSDAQALSSRTILIPGASAYVVGEAPELYLFLATPLNPIQYARVLLLDNNIAVLDRDLVLSDPLLTGDASYTLTTAVTGLQLTFTQPTNGQPYLFSAYLTRMGGSLAHFEAAFTAVAALPRVQSARSLEDGQVVITFTGEVRQDLDLARTSLYRVFQGTLDEGLATARVDAVRPLAVNQVLLETSGITLGTHTVMLEDSSLALRFNQDAAEMADSVTIGP